MNGDSSSLNVLKDALVGCRLSTFVVFWLEPIDGNHHVQLFVLSPLRRNGTESARNNLGMDAASFDLRYQFLEFVIAYHRVPPHQRNMKGSEVIQDSQNPGDEFITLEIGKLAEQSGTPRVGFVKGVAARAPEGTFLRDLNRKRRSTPGKNGAPCLENFTFFHYRSKSNSQCGRSGYTSRITCLCITCSVCAWS